MMDESADRVTTHEHLTANGDEHATNCSLQSDTICAKYIKPKVQKVKVKVTLVQALRLCTDRTAHRGSRGIALLFHDQRH